MKIRRAIYRLSHEGSDAGRVGYIGKDKHFPSRIRFERRRKEKGCTKLYAALNKYPLALWRAELVNEVLVPDELSS